MFYTRLQPYTFYSSSELELTEELTDELLILIASFLAEEVLKVIYSGDSKLLLDDDAWQGAIVMCGLLRK